MWWDGVVGMDRQELSDLAGSASFVVWLFAQSPQLYENYRNSSCEGLSIVFLAQWMAGDATNLIGSILTQQLPFQIAVATYFCCIDSCILAQYFYYWHRDRQREQQSSKSSLRRRGRAYYSSTLEPSMRASSLQASLSRAHRASSHSPSTSIYRNDSQPAKRQRAVLLDQHYFHLSHDTTSSYKALGDAARSVAELANEFARRVAVRDASRQERWRRKYSVRGGKAAKGKDVDRGDGSASEEESGEVGEEPAKMIDSVYSDSSRNSEGYGYGFGTASTTLERKEWEQREGALALQLSPTGNKRGRDMTRMAGKVMALSVSRSPAPPSVEAPAGGPSQSPLQTEPAVVTASPTPSPAAPNPVSPLSRPDHSRSSKRTSRSTKSPVAPRGSSSIVLLGVTALFGLQGLNLHGQGPSNQTARTPTYTHDRVGILSTPLDPVYSAPAAVPMARRPITLSYSPRPHPYQAPAQPSWERVVGRISAWTCTVLYMTSRLPQIWTNLSRKSVQGLSILLFISAALGNALYTLSVLANPLASGETGPDFLWESLPFLLGSGGTLIFDAIIVAQWIAWRGQAPITELSTHHHHHRRGPTYRGSSLASRNTSEANRWASLERQPLLE